MNVENFVANETQQPLDTQTSDSGADVTQEITLLPTDCFRLIGGGSSAVID
jgi:hypothetical protein